MPDDVKREIETMADAKPQWDDNGVPYCAGEKCHQYDGKRCRATGFRPGPMCEPCVVVMADLLNRRTP